MYHIETMLSPGWTRVVYAHPTGGILVATGGILVATGGILVEGTRLDLYRTGRTR